MQDDEENLNVKIVKFSMMQDEFFFSWGMEIAELQEVLKIYIDQGETDVAEEMKKY